MNCPVDPGSLPVLHLDAEVSEDELQAAAAARAAGQPFRSFDEQLPFRDADFAHSKFPEDPALLPDADAVIDVEPREASVLPPQASRRVPSHRQKLFIIAALAGTTAIVGAVGAALILKSSKDGLSEDFRNSSTQEQLDQIKAGDVVLRCENAQGHLEKIDAPRTPQELTQLYGFGCQPFAVFERELKVR